MADLTLKKGDKGYALSFPIQNSDGTVKDLTDYTVNFKVWSQLHPGVLLINRACTVTNPSDGLCYYMILAGDFNLSGIFIFELELAKSGVVESSESYTLQVLEGG